MALVFNTGGEMPPEAAMAGVTETFGRVPRTGCLLLGERGTLSAGLWNSECYLKMKGETKFKGGNNHDAAKAVPRTLPRAQGHLREWVDACKGGQKVFSDFDLGGHLTEIGLAGVVALRLERDIEWDGPAMTVKGAPEAAALVKPQYRRRWRFQRTASRERAAATDGREQPLQTLAAASGPQVRPARGDDGSISAMEKGHYP